MLYNVCRNFQISLSTRRAEKMLILKEVARSFRKRKNEKIEKEKREEFRNYAKLYWNVAFFFNVGGFMPEFAEFQQNSEKCSKIAP